MGNKPGKPTKPMLPLLLKKHRDRLGWSQEKLGEKLGMSGATINRVEKGKQNWDQEFLQIVAEALGVSWVEILPRPTGSVLDLWDAVDPDDRPTAARMLKGLTEKE